MISRRSFLLLLVGSLLTTGCIKQAAKTLSELVIVRAEIMEKFGEEVNVNLNTFGDRTSLIITFINSSLNDGSQSERAKRAQETADLVKLHYRQIHSLSGILVTFMSQQTRLVVFHYSNTIDTFGFDKDARPVSSLDARTEVSTPTLDLETTATYSDHSNESDISVRGLQLEGYPGAGLTLIPHFKVAGNANEKKSKAPSFVVFDFASYEEREKFTGEVIFDFLVDGNRVVSTQGRFSHSTPPRAKGQFCNLRIPYKNFQLMLGGKSLTIKIDNTPYELAPEQFVALKKMTSYVKE